MILLFTFSVCVYVCVTLHIIIYNIHSWFNYTIVSNNDEKDNHIRL